MEMIEIVKKFQIKGNIISFEKYGCGHINGTYLLVTDQNKYIFQKINQHIFKNVEGLMNNISLVTTFIKKEVIKNGGDPYRETMTIIPTLKGDNFYYCSECDSYFRIYLFIDKSFDRQIATSKEEFAESGTAFGKFQNLLAKFDATQLVEIIPNFHNTVKRFEHFLQVLKADKYNRAQFCRSEIDFVLQREKDCSQIVSLINAHQIPLKVTHNDTKLNNVLFDELTGKCLAVIDLDTIMPGSSLYDFGDSIRFGCNTSSEDEKDLSKVNFSIDYFKAYTEAFLGEVKETMNQAEIDFLAFSAKLMTLECGIRFLDDYLDGNQYFATKYEEHNLIRARTQFKLVSEMEKNMDKMNQIVHQIAKR